MKSSLGTLLSRVVVGGFLLAWALVFLAGSSARGFLGDYEADLRFTIAFVAGQFLSPLDRAAGVLSSLTGFSGEVCAVALMSAVGAIGAFVCFRWLRSASGARRVALTFLAMTALTFTFVAPYVFWRWDVFAK